MGKNCALGLEYVRPRAVLKTSGTVFPIRTSRPVNNIYKIFQIVQLSFFNINVITLKRRGFFHEEMSRASTLSVFSIRIRIRISTLKFAKLKEYLAEILKRINKILCVETSVNTIQFLWF